MRESQKLRSRNRLAVGAQSGGASRRLPAPAAAPAWRAAAMADMKG